MINEVFYLLAPKMLLQDIRPMQGTFNCGNLVSGVGGSGDPRRNGRKWESEKGREREGERESVEKCCFCLQNDLKEP